MHQGQPDAVDRILEQWRRERPDVDVAPMGPIGRLGRCAALLQKRLDETFARFGLSPGEFDVLAALRRSGAPYRLSPTALFSTLMITSGTMTHRLRRLETAGLVVREPDPADRRSLLVALSEPGLALVDQVVVAHVENEARLLAALDPAALAQLDARLAELLATLEGPGAAD